MLISLANEAPCPLGQYTECDMCTLDFPTMQDFHPISAVLCVISSTSRSAVLRSEYSGRVAITLGHARHCNPSLPLQEIADFFLLQNLHIGSLLTPLEAFLFPDCGFGDILALEQTQELLAARVGVCD